MTNKGVSLEEIKRLFEYLEQSKTNNKMQVIITNDMCKSLYDIYMTMYEYQKMVKNRIDKAIEYIEYYFAKGRTKNHKQFDLSLYEILTGKNLFDLTMGEIEQFFKGVDKE